MSQTAKSEWVKKVFRAAVREISGQKKLRYGLKWKISCQSGQKEEIDFKTSKSFAFLTFSGALKGGRFT